MRVAVFLKLQDADERERLALSPAPREIDAHQAPQLADIAISSLAISSRKFFWIYRQRRQTRQLVFRRYLRHALLHFLEFWLAAAIATVGAAEQTRVGIFSGFTALWPGD